MRVWLVWSGHDDEDEKGFVGESLIFSDEARAREYAAGGSFSTDPDPMAHLDWLADRDSRVVDFARRVPGCTLHDVTIDEDGAVVPMKPRQTSCEPIWWAWIAETGPKVKERGEIVQRSTGRATFGGRVWARDAEHAAEIARAHQRRSIEVGDLDAWRRQFEERAQSWARHPNMSIEEARLRSNARVEATHDACYVHDECAEHHEMGLACARR